MCEAILTGYVSRLEPAAVDDLPAYVEDVSVTVESTDDRRKESDQGEDKEPLGSKVALDFKTTRKCCRAVPES